MVLEHVTRLRDDLGAEWPQPAGQGCYRVEITGEPNYTLDLQLMGTDGDHNTAGLKATAMRLVDAVPAVVVAPPGARHCPRPPADHRTRARRHLSGAGESVRPPVVGIGPAAGRLRPERPEFPRAPGGTASGVMGDLKGSSGLHNR